MASSRRAVLEADAGDLYHRRLGPVLAVAAAAWLVWAFGVSSGRVERLADGTLVSFSRDAGLKMTLREAMPRVLLRTHSVGGAALLFSAMLQKWLAGRMLGSRAAVTWHRFNGYACLFLMACMALPGYLMGPFSAWERFETFSVGFAAPYAFWIVTIALTAYFRLYRWHRLFANQALKGCITVPLARLVGGIVQRAFPELGEALGYYLGIGMVTIFVGLWEMSDVYAFVIQPCAVTAMDRRNRAKMK